MKVEHGPDDQPFLIRNRWLSTSMILSGSAFSSCVMEHHRGQDHCPSFGMLPKGKLRAFVFNSFPSFGLKMALGLLMSTGYYIILHLIP